VETEVDLGGAVLRGGGSFLDVVLTRLEHLRTNQGGGMQERAVEGVAVFLIRGEKKGRENLRCKEKVPMKRARANFLH